MATRTRTLTLTSISVASGAAALLLGCISSAKREDDLTERIAVPKIWDEEELATWATPLALIDARPGFYSEAEYFAAPVDNLKTYPVYHPDREPPGYREWLKAQRPAPLIGPERVRTKKE